MLVYSDIKGLLASIPNLNLTEDDPRLMDKANQAQEYIIQHSSGLVLHKKIVLCTDQSCITWPRQVASLTDFAVCKDPIPVRNEWYELLPDGPGVYVGQKDSILEAHSRGGGFCTIADINGTGKTLKIYTDVDEDTDAYLWVYGLDGDGIWLRTDVDGERVDGERIPIVDGQVSVNELQTLERARKTGTHGRVRVYELDAVAGTERLLAIYEPDETNPDYQRTLLRGLATGTNCGSTTVVAMAKLEHIPLKRDDDFLIVQSRNAMWFMVQALVKFENNQEKAGLGLAGLAMTEMGFFRDHKSPKEQISIVRTAQPIGNFYRWRIGSMK